MSRKSTGKRLRFEVLKRDGFRCIYCGASPMNSALTVKLHADHVDPASNGGETNPANLVTACQDCNLGKSDVPLDKKKLKSQFGSEEEKEHAEQIREYLKVQRDIGNAKKEVEQAVLERWESMIGEWHPDLIKHVPMAIKEFGLQFVLDAVDIVARKGIRREIEQVKYFCGILRKTREDKASKAKQPEKEDLNDAIWRIAISAITAYLEHRFYGGDDLRSPVGDLVRSAIGAPPGKPSPLSFGDLFRAADAAAWLKTNDSIGDPEADFRRIVEAGIADSDAIPCETFIHEEVDESILSSKRMLAFESHYFWEEEFGTKFDFSVHGETLTDVIRNGQTVHFLSGAFKVIGAEERGKTFDEQLSAFRVKMARFLKRHQMVFLSSPVAAWPEYIAAPNPPESDGE